MPKPIQDEHLVRASLQRCLESSVVVPTMFWTEKPQTRGLAYEPIPKCEGHALGIHGHSDMHARHESASSVGKANVIDLTQSGQGVFPFSERLWLFQPRPDTDDRPAVGTPGDARNTIVVLPDGKTVTLRAARLYAKATPQYAAWVSNPLLATPWCTAPTLQLLASTLRQARPG